jgi:hypothetical protein
MYQNDIDGEIIEMTCRQLGASKVEELEGSLYYIEFPVKDCCTLSYTFNTNRKSDYHLQRIQPYPFAHDPIKDEEDVIEFIKKDLARFRNAAKSTNFMTFVDSVNKLITIGERMDDLFLNFNVDKEAVNDIAEHINDIEAHICKVKNGSCILQFQCEEE